MTWDIRGCPACGRSVRVDADRCPGCLEELNVDVPIVVEVLDGGEVLEREDGTLRFPLCYTPNMLVRVVPNGPDVPRFVRQYGTSCGGAAVWKWQGSENGKIWIDLTDEQVTKLVPIIRERGLIRG